MAKSKMTVAQKRAREYGASMPKSLCVCGHTGDGAMSEHAPRFADGHGQCTHPGCDCKQFSWAAWASAFKEVLAFARPSAKAPKPKRRLADGDA